MAIRKLSSAIKAFFVIAILATGISCSKKTPSDLSKESIIPKPVSISATGSYFMLKARCNIYVQGESDELKLTGQYLADRIKASTGFAIEVKSTAKAPRPGNIYLTLSDADGNRGEEGYELVITKNLIKLSARTPAGLFRGVQTIRQLLPATIESNTKQEGPWKIATGTITDYPEYSYRGAMLDVARHFFGVDDVKRFIDFLAFYKMNVLHLHLSDDQGWRIEIKSWPDLTVVGGSTQVGGAKGGFYTQEQYADIVKYAKEKYITIVPEIDMPGHINSALASYAELNCDGKAKKLYTGTDVGFSTLCTKMEITYKFVGDVIRELSEITPGPYIHIGGDESLVTKKEDYVHFINKVLDIVSAHGKQVIGWDEISLSGLKANSVAQHWADDDNAKRAVNQGAKILMSPASKIYLDMKYDSTTSLGLHWAGYIEVDTAYIWDPAALIAGVGKENIIGIEAPLWTETISNMKEIEYMVFPRLPGYAEIGWSPAAARNWDEYKVRLGRQAGRFRAMDINFYRSGLVPWAEEKK